MSEFFIERARARLYEAVQRAEKEPISRALAKSLLELADIVAVVVDAVDDEGCLPSSVCTAVVKYGRAK